MSADTVAVLEEAGRRYRAHRRYGTHHRGVTVWGCGQAVSVVATTLEQLRERGADTAVWRRLGCDGMQTLTPARDAWKAGTTPPVPDLGGPAPEPVCASLSPAGPRSWSLALLNRLQGGTFVRSYLTG
ncbi:hypothetical protein [Streptomyces hirsutus]|uniref:hypothetical protein n=1 Tax=Streptomyces hirsutus TaxID=35620 RepID=UPI003682A801